MEVLEIRATLFCYRESKVVVCNDVGVDGRSVDPNACFGQALPLAKQVSRVHWQPRGNTQTLITNSIEEGLNLKSRSRSGAPRRSATKGWRAGSRDSGKPLILLAEMVPKTTHCKVSMSALFLSLGLPWILRLSCSERLEGPCRLCASPTEPCSSGLRGGRGPALFSLLAIAAPEEDE